MKLLEIYIAGFGKLSGQKIGFIGGLNSFLWDNGEGKSTLCEFITAMLYGMDSLNARDKELKPRAHYMPFDGSSFGGSMTFTHAIDGVEKRCRIERQFDRKSLTGDTVKFYVNGDEVSCGNDIGYELLGVGPDTFRNLAYMNPFTMIPSGNSEISGKIGNFENDENLLYAKAREELDKAKTELQPKTRRADTHSRIPILEDRLTSLKLELRRLEAVRDGLPAKYEEREKLLEGLRTNKALVEDIRRRRRLIEKWDDYDRGMAELVEKKRRLEEKTGRFPGKLPELSEVDGMRNAAEAVRINRGRADVIGFGPEEEARLDDLSRNCAEGRIGAYGDDSLFGADFGLLEADISEVERTKNSADSREENLRRGAEDPEQKKLEERFGGRENEISSLENDIPGLTKAAQDAENAFRNGASDHEALKEKMRRRETGMAVAGAVLLTLGILAVAAGVILKVANAGISPALFYAAAGAGAVLFATGLGLLIGRAAVRKKGTGLEKIGELEKKARDAKAELSGRLGAFGEEYTSDNGAGVFLSHVEYYRRSVSAAKREETEIASLRENAAEKERDLEKYFKVYGISEGSLRERFDAIKSMKRELEALSVKKKNAASTSYTTSSALAVISDFIEKYMPDVTAEELISDPETVKTDVTLIGVLSGEITSSESRLAGFRAGLGDEERPGPVPDGAEALYSNNIVTLEGRLREVEISIRRDENETERIGEFEANIMDTEEKLNDAKVFYAELTLADRLLEKAEKELKDRHMGPVTARFETYRKDLENAVGAGITLRRDFTVEFEKSGALRKQEHLSTGQLACVALCVKLALAEGIMGGDRCFMVLDDPFMSLSNANLEAVKKLLRRIGETKQIIYLTCSSERDMKP